MKYQKHLKHTLATYAFGAMSPYCSDEWRQVVAELDASAEVGGDAWSSLVQQRRSNLLHGMASHETPSLACFRRGGSLAR
jgi:hypothetical protein